MSIICSGWFYQNTQIAHDGSITLASQIMIVATIIIVALIATFSIALNRIQKRKPIETSGTEDIPYLKAVELAKRLLTDRYEGQRGYLRPYIREFNFKWSSGTLQKCFQERNPTPNPRYVQRVLDDLEPGKYNVLTNRGKERNIAS